MSEDPPASNSDGEELAVQEATMTRLFDLAKLRVKEGTRIGDITMASFHDQSNPETVIQVSWWDAPRKQLGNNKIQAQVTKTEEVEGSKVSTKFFLLHSPDGLIVEKQTTSLASNDPAVKLADAALKGGAPTSAIKEFGNQIVSDIESERGAMETERQLGLSSVNEQEAQGLLTTLNALG